MNLSFLVFRTHTADLEGAIAKTYYANGPPLSATVSVFDGGLR